MKKPFYQEHNSIFIERLENHSEYDVPVQQYHNSYELYLIMRGERTLFYNNTRYTLKCGDVAFIKPFELHSAESCGSEFYERYVLNFRSEDFGCILTHDEIRLLFGTFDSRLIHLDDEQLRTVTSSLSMTERLTAASGMLAKKAAYANIFSLLTYLKNIKPISLSGESNGVPAEIISAINYIGSHYGEYITLDTMADMVHISKYHFCRLFKQATGVSFVEYLRNVRLSQAHRLLREDTMSISDIAAGTGFESVSYFSKVFKAAYGLSPRELKKRHISLSSEFKPH